MTRPRTGSNASSMSPACPPTPPSASAHARLAAHRRRPSGRSAFGSGTWLVPPGVGIDDIGAGAGAIPPSTGYVNGGVGSSIEGMITPTNNGRSLSLPSSTGSSPQTPLQTLSPMVPLPRNGRDGTPLGLRGRRPRPLPLAGSTTSDITTWHESKDEENEEEVSRSSISSVSVASESLVDDDDDDTTSGDESPASRASRRSSNNNGGTHANGVTSPPLSTSSTSTTVTTWSSISSTASLSARYPPPPLPPPPAVGAPLAASTSAFASSVQAMLGSPLPPPTPPIVDYTSFGLGIGSGDGTTLPPSAGRGRGNSDSCIGRGIRSGSYGSYGAADTDEPPAATGGPIDASRIAARRQAKRDRALARLAAARHENREVYITLLSFETLCISPIVITIVCINL
jgi:hypothetical protein